MLQVMATIIVVRRLCPPGPPLIDQLDRLTAATDRAKARNPKTARENANVKLHVGLAKLILETVPSDPGAR